MRRNTGTYSDIEMKIEINRKDKTPVYIQIAGQIKNKLHTGEITDGYVLPSERVLAAELGVHRNTVTRAYGELKSEGLLDSSRGSCYRISFKGSAGYSETTEPDRRKAVSWEAVMRREYDEFISSHPADVVIRAEVLLQNTDEPDQYLISRFMSVGIIDR